MREPIREPNPQEQRPGRAPENLRPVGLGPVGEAVPFTGNGLIEWAPTWTGMFVSLGVFFLMSALGVAIGIGTGAVGIAIWEAISMIVAFFIGGWITGRTMSLVDPLIAGAHGLLVWAVAMVFTIAALIATTLSGVGALANIARIPFVSSLLTSVGAPSPVAVGATTAAVASSWVVFIILLLGVIAAIIGALVGNQALMASQPGFLHRGEPHR